MLSVTGVGNVFLLMRSVYGNYYIAFILPLLFLVPAKIFPEGMQDCQLLQAYPAAPGETAGKFCLHCQQASESYLRCGQQGVCGESATLIGLPGKTVRLWLLGLSGWQREEGRRDHGNRSVWGGTDVHKQLNSAGL